MDAHQPDLIIMKPLVDGISWKDGMASQAVVGGCKLEERGVGPCGSKAHSLFDRWR